MTMRGRAAFRGQGTFVCAAIAAIGLGCSNSPASGTDAAAVVDAGGGDAGSFPLANCDDIGRALCTITASCEPYVDTLLDGGSVEACSRREASYCRAQTTGVGSTWTLDDAIACTRRATASCEVYLTYNSLPECERPAGTQPDGAPCAVDNQCRSLRCTNGLVHAGLACDVGVCATTVAEGAPCTGASDCAGTMYCTAMFDAAAADHGASGPQRCLRLVDGDLGAPCSDATNAICKAGDYCDPTTQVCTAGLPLGATCTHGGASVGGDPCDDRIGHCSGTAANPVGTCVAELGYGDACTPGSACWSGYLDVVSPPYTDCPASGVCPTRGAGAEGAACTSALDCAEGVCFGGHCAAECCGSNCGAGQRCVDPLVFNNPGLCLDVVDCDPLAQTGCGAGLGCYPVDAVASDRVCAPPGALSEGQACFFVGECQPGLYCGGSGTCQRVCDVSAPVCGSLETCSPRTWASSPNGGVCT